MSDPQVPKPLEAICLKAMAFDKKDRYATPLALAEDVEKHLAGAATTAYAEPFLARVGRWVRRHRRRISQLAAVTMLAVIGGYAIHVQREANLLAEREQARHQLSEFRRLADEAQFFAANTDAFSERVPYYEPRRAMQAGEAALAIANAWGDGAARLPLAEERTEFLRSQYGLLLLMAQAKLQSVDPQDSPRQALALVDRARLVGEPSRGFFTIRSQCLASLGESQAAELERTRAAAPTTPITAQDHFLAGERLRLLDVGTSGQVVADTSDGPVTVRREHLNAALDEYHQALQLDPQHYWARFQLGRCLMALGRSPEAIGVLSGCIALQPTSPWAYATRGLASGIGGQFEDGISDLDQALQLDPEFQPARLNRGVVHWLHGEHEQASADFAVVLDASGDKRLVEAAFYRGQVQIDQGREREAVADFSTVLAEKPDFRLAYWFRALANFRLGDVAAGEADITRFVALDPRQPESAPAAQRHAALGRAFRKMAQQIPAEARAAVLRVAGVELQAAIDAGPPTAEVWRHLGAVRELDQLNAEAIAAYTHGLALSPNDVQLRNLRAWAYVVAQNFELARGDFSAVILTSADNAEAHAGLGFVLAELGQEDMARQEASTALLVAADNQLVLHNVACIYGRLSATKPERRIEYENQALTSLQRAKSISRQNFLGLDADELTLIRNELSFPDSLKSRREFQLLVEENP